MAGGGWRRKRHGFDSLPLYLRRAPCSRWAARDRPDTDHVDGLTLRAFPGTAGSRTVRVGDATFTVETTDDAVVASGPAGSWSLQVGDAVAASEDGSARLPC